MAAEARSLAGGPATDQPASNETAWALPAAVDRRPVASAELRGVLSDPNLSLAAKGLLALVLCCPPGRRIGRAVLFRACSDPIEVVDRAIGELVRGGWLATVPPSGRATDSRIGGVTRRGGRGPRAAEGGDRRV